jgi:hypothetical protein
VKRTQELGYQIFDPVKEASLISSIQRRLGDVKGVKFATTIYVLALHYSTINTSSRFQSIVCNGRFIDNKNKVGISFVVGSLPPALTQIIFTYVKEYNEGTLPKEFLEDP